jgi:hypothetical protein
MSCLIRLGEHASVWLVSCGSACCAERCNFRVKNRTKRVPWYSCFMNLTLAVPATSCQHLISEHLRILSTCALRNISYATGPLFVYAANNFCTNVCETYPSFAIPRPSPAVSISSHLALTSLCSREEDSQQSSVGSYNRNIIARVG